MRIFSKKAVPAAVLLSIAAAGANAATETTTFGVSAEISDSCSVSASALSFGTVDPLSGSDAESTTTITVKCANGTAYDIGLDAGTATDATVTSRQMTDGSANTLDYNLYSDSGRNTNWGNTVGTDTVNDTGSGADQTHTVYGSVPTGQETAPVGSYSDTITVTVTY